MKKQNPSKNIEIKKWKMSRQYYINKLSNYMSIGFTLIPHDKRSLLYIENKLALLEEREPLSFDEIKNKIIKKLEKK